MHACILWRLANETRENRLAKFHDNSRKPCITLHEKTCLLCEEFAVLGLQDRNKPDSRSHVEASMFTPEAISGKTFQRLIKEKANLTREIDKGKNCWNFA